MTRELYSTNVRMSDTTTTRASPTVLLAACSEQRAPTRKPSPSDTRRQAPLQCAHNTDVSHGPRRPPRFTRPRPPAPLPQIHPRPQAAWRYRTRPSPQTTSASLPPSVFTLPHMAQLEALYTIIWHDRETSRGNLLFYSDRIIRLQIGRAHV